jgi:hypothetical protein
MANTVASTALSTDAQPLIAHAQGIKSGAFLPSRASPVGLGIPIQNASGAISKSEIKILAKSGSGVSHWSMGG